MTIMGPGPGLKPFHSSLALLAEELASLILEYRCLSRWLQSALASVFCLLISFGGYHHWKKCFEGGGWLEVGGVQIFVAHTVPCNKLLPQKNPCRGWFPLQMIPGHRAFQTPPHLPCLQWCCLALIGGIGKTPI